MTLPLFLLQMQGKLNSETSLKLAKLSSPFITSTNYYLLEKSLFLSTKLQLTKLTKVNLISPFDLKSYVIHHLSEKKLIYLN